MLKEIYSYFELWVNFNNCLCQYNQPSAFQTCIYLFKAKCIIKLLEILWDVKKQLVY